MKKIVCFYSFILASLFCAIMQASYMMVFANKQTIELFETNGIVMTANYIDKNTQSTLGNCGLLMSASEEKSSAKLNASVSGEFSLDFQVLNTSSQELKEISFTFTDSEKNTFDLILTIAEKLYMKVYANEQYAGIYYDKGYVFNENRVHGLTKGYNSNGEYTLLDNNGLMSINFNPETMQVYGGNYNSKYLIWDFSKKNNDGKDLGISFSPFVAYDVSISFNKIDYNKEAKILLYNINGQKLNSKLLKNNKAPNIMADFNERGITNKIYTIPKPYVYDVIDGAILSNEVNVVVSNAGNQNVYIGKYRDDATFLPNNGGIYTIRYSIKDVNGLEETKIYKLNVANAEKYGENQWITKGGFPKKEIGINSEIQIPKIQLISPLLMREEKIDTNIKLYYNDELFKEVNPGEKITFNKLGKYEFKYSSAKKGIDAEKTFIINVVSSLIGIQYIEISEDLCQYDIIDIPEVNMTLNENEKRANSIVRFPSKAIYSNKQIKLSEIGKYEIIYSVWFGNKEYEYIKEFIVYQNSENMFVDKNGLASIKNGSSRMNDNMAGLFVSMSGDSEVEYANTIDLKNKSKDDCLIEMIVSPKKTTVADFRQLTIKLTDINDENNFVEIVAVDCGLINLGGSGMYVKAGANGQIKAGLNGGELIDTRQEYGYGSVCSFRDIYLFGTDIKHCTYRLYFDSTENAIYSSYSWAQWYGGRPAVNNFVIDLDDLKYFSKPWKGFSVNEVKLSITVQQVESSADIVIMNVDNYDLSEKQVKDIDKPQIKIELPNNIVPEGCVGIPYKIFDAKAIDKWQRESPIDANVYFNKSDKIKCNIDSANGYFTPEETGDYEIIYTSTDIFGNTAERVVNIKINNTLEDIGYSIINKQENGKVGENIKLAEVEITQAYGNAEVNIDVKNLATNQNVAIQKNSFFADKIGQYEVTYTIKDFFNRTSKTSYSVNIVRNEMPMLMDDINLPIAFINGFSYDMPQAEAKDYSIDAQNPKLVQAEIYITDGNGKIKLTDGKYKAKINGHKQNIKVEYVFKGEVDLVKEFTIKGVTDCKNENNEYDLSKYFISDDVEITSNINGIIFSSNSTGKIIYAKEVLATNFKLKMSVNELKNNFEILSIILQDSSDSKISVKLDIKKAAEKVLFSINGGRYLDMAGSFLNSLKEIQLNYSNKDFKFSDGENNNLGTVQKCFNGDDFNGFISNKIYVTLQLENVTGQSEFKIFAINNQQIASNIIDTVAPDFNVVGNYGGSVAINSKIEIPYAIACDVITEIKFMTVSVKAPNGSFMVSSDNIVLDNVPANRKYSFSVSEIGSYRVTYYTQDINGYDSSTFKFIRVLDTISPEIIFSEDIPNEVKVNAIIALPKYTLNDNLGNEKVKCHIMVVQPDGRISNIENTFVQNKTGKYIIRYYIYDEAFNVVIKDFFINVIE